MQILQRMCKRWARLPRGVTIDDVNAKMRERRNRRGFLDELKAPKQKYVEMTHDGTDFTIKARGNGDFWVDTGTKRVSGSTYRRAQKDKHTLPNTQAT